MTNDLLVAAERCMERVQRQLNSETVWKSMPLGHSGFQIRQFVLNDREFPKGPAKFRQAIRELWGRWGAYRQAKNGLEDLEIEEAVLKADQMEWRFKRSILPWKQARRAAMLKRIGYHLARIATARQELLFDLEHRIIRETTIFMEEAMKNAPSDAAKEFSMEAELAVWKHRAQHQPQLTEMLAGSEGDDPNGKMV